MAAKKKTPAKKPAVKKKSAVAKKKPTAAKKKTTTAAPKSAAKPKRAPVKKKAPPRKAQRTAKRPAVKRKPAPKKRVVKPQGPALPEAPVALALAQDIAHVAIEKKAFDVVIIDARERASSVGYDYVVLASGESDRQLSAIHEGVDELLKPQGRRAAVVEASPDWVCVTYDEGVIAHFFTTDRRGLTDLEGLWRDAPRVKP